MKYIKAEMVVSGKAFDNLTKDKITDLDAEAKSRIGADTSGNCASNAIVKENVS